jgi:hypothetical protein
VNGLASRCVVDLWARFNDHKCLVVLSEATLATDRPRSRLDFDPEAFAVRHIDAAERAAARVWTGNWQSMLPVLVAARGLVKPSMLGAIERFVASPQSLMTIERECHVNSKRFRNPIALAPGLACECLNWSPVKALKTKSLG